ncbi:MAG: AAA family ATPase [Parcubacteria group bacterium]|nr:AAA family ATPase [Parcubacteria group bacterium]
MKNKKIIAILGLPGSGKTEVIEYLIKKFNWPKVYFGEVTFDEIKKRKLPINEKNERLVREAIRKKYGLDYYARQVYKKINKLKNKKIILLESLYGWDEYKYLKNKFKNNLFTIAVYASPRARYQRLESRNYRPLTSRQAISRDYAQIENLHQGGPIAMANFTIINQGDLANLHKQIDQIL